MQKPNFDILESLLENNDLKKIKKDLKEIQKKMDGYKGKTVEINLNGQIQEVNPDYLSNEIEQIIKTFTLERTKYYIKRLIKSLTEEKRGKINDLNLNRWKEYEDIITNSLWVLDKRDKSGEHKGTYWGNFIPQIPNQLLRRFTRKGEWVLDPFLGSGTTLIECKRLGRNGIGIELLENIAAQAKKTVEKETSLFDSDVITKIITADSTSLNYKIELRETGIKSVQFLIMHPPYWDIIKFGSNEKELSNAKSLDDFLDKLGRVIDKTYHILDKGRYFALVIGDKYSNGEWIPLGFYAMQEVLKRNYKLKSIIVKNFEETKGKMKQKELWRYRALAGGFYIFKHEYIFLFQKN
jgi:DNA modification methylase